jgi:hypothetical protein
LKTALDAIAEALNQQGLEDDERKAILVAVKDLYDMSKQSSFLPGSSHDSHTDVQQAERE